MENRIYDIKNKLLCKIEEETQDIDRMDYNAVGVLIDAIHHLAETEYYCSVADAMWAEKHGYTSGGGTGSSTPITQARMGYSQPPMRYGYMPPEPIAQGRMGYHNPVEDLRSEYQKASPDERERMRVEVMKMVGAM